MSHKIETFIFDLDGTLYQIDGNASGYKGSSLEASVIKNAKAYILETENCTEEEANQILQQALKDSVGISRFLSERYNISRQEYFGTVWNISPVGIVKNFEIAVQVINRIRDLNLNLILLTTAPTVWQKTVLAFLGLSDHFSEIYTGDSFSNKREIFEQLAQRFSPNTSLSVGDQLETDIKPAEELGFLTLHIKSPNDLLTVLQLIGETYEKSHS